MRPRQSSPFGQCSPVGRASAKAAHSAAVGYLSPSCLFEAESKQGVSGERYGRGAKSRNGESGSNAYVQADFDSGA